MATAKGLRSLAQPSLDWRRASEQYRLGRQPWQEAVWQVVKNSALEPQGWGS